jgi:TolB-like protein
MAFPLPDKPSIAVLPFTNLSDDPSQEYFADGMTEDLITDLSKISGLFVIARNSSFYYKGQQVKVRQVAEDLGVRYVLEGSVRRAGDTVRINAQLIDATTGGHIWADRYDGTLADVFALQDQVTRNVVVALSLRLTPEGESFQAHPDTTSLEAYDQFLKGWEHYKKRTPKHYAKALTYFAKAVELDPDYGLAHAAMAWIYWNSAYQEWSVALGLGMQKAKELARNSAERALKHPTPLAHQVVSQIRIREWEHDDAIAEAELSLSINPNDADGNYALAEALIMAGRPHEVSGLLERARRLDPHSQDYYSYLHGMAQFGLNRFEAAAASFERAIELNPDYWEADPSIGWCTACEMLASTYGHLGRMNDAKEMIRKVRKYWPQYSINSAVYWWPYKQLTDRERLSDGLRKAGLPDYRTP